MILAPKFDAAALKYLVHRRKRDPQKRRVLPIVCDMANAANVTTAVDIVLEHFGRIDVLINNAGIIQVGPLEHMTRDDFRQAMDTHFWGALHGIQAVLPYMKRRGAGRIVNIASKGGLVAVPHLAPYTASKFALVALSEALRAEVRIITSQARAIAILIAFLTASLMAAAAQLLPPADAASGLRGLDRCDEPAPNSHSG